MIPKKPAPDVIRGGRGFRKKITLKQQAKAKYQINVKSFRFGANSGEVLQRKIKNRRRNRRRRC
jgi:hypothetical protein